MPNANQMHSKMGFQVSADDPFTFVMSTDTIDRYGDSVKQNWDLKSFKVNPIALFSHTASLPIGTWKSVRVVGNQLIGKLQMAKQGTSELIDTIRSLLEQGIIKAVSVGFVSHKQEPIDPEQPWAGYNLDKNELMECSVCSIPANSESLMLATKSMNITKQTRDFLNASVKTIDSSGVSNQTITNNKNRIKIHQRNLT